MYDKSSFQVCRQSKLKELLSRPVHFECAVDFLYPHYKKRGWRALWPQKKGKKFAPSRIRTGVWRMSQSLRPVFPAKKGSECSEPTIEGSSLFFYFFKEFDLLPRHPKNDMDLFRSVVLSFIGGESGTLEWRVSVFFFNLWEGLQKKKISPY